VKHPSLLDLVDDDFGAQQRFPRVAHIGGRVGVGFAGGGGSSLGLKWAGLKIDFAMNHDAAAIAMHAANCPEALHYCQDIWQVRPEDPCPGEPIRFMWFSPDCKHFSKAKGGEPVEKKIRDLAWVIVLWAKIRRPDVICMENVEEFMDWGPLMPDPKRPGKMIPDPKRKGEYFRAFVGEFRKLGYQCGFVKERAFRYGIPGIPAAPTIRQRMFGQFRCDGHPITWPEPTHGAPDDPDVIAGKLLPWRTIAECIDWTRRCPSIFLTREEARAVRAKRPLESATMARLTLGLQRHVLEADKPFIVSITHSGPPRVYDTDEPGRTQTCANRGEHALVQPYMTGCGGRRGQSPPIGVDRPGPTGTCKPDEVIVAAHLIKFHGDSGGAPMDTPGPTMTANSYEKRPGCSAPVGLGAAFVTGAGGAEYSGRPKAVDRPGISILPDDRQSIVAATMIQTGYGERPGQEPRVLDIQAPVGAQVAGGAKHAPVAVYMAQHNGGMIGHDLPKPLSTLTGGGSQQQLVAANLLHLRGGGDRFGNGADEPSPTDTAQGNHLGISAAFLVKYYGVGGNAHPANEPTGTITPKDRFALVMVDMSAVGLTEEQRYTAYWVARMIDVWGHPAGLPPKGRRRRKDAGSLRLRTLAEQIDRDLTPRPSAVATRDGNIVWDVGMRMLTVRERFRAQGVPDDFIIDVLVDGKPITETKQGEMCGNMVCPPHAAAIARAALPELREPEAQAVAA
jgi:DNA (cytosine-5)-methyltransferase 1